MHVREVRASVREARVRSMLIIIFSCSSFRRCDSAMQSCRVKFMLSLQPQNSCMGMTQFFAHRARMVGVVGVLHTGEETRFCGIGDAMI